MVCQEKVVDLKSMQENLLISLMKITKSGGGIELAKLIGSVQDKLVKVGWCEVLRQGCKLVTSNFNRLAEFWGARSTSPYPALIGKCLTLQGESYSASIDQYVRVSHISSRRYFHYFASSVKKH